MTDIAKLADDIAALGTKGSNTLDVQVEIALFKPNSVYTAIRSNEAGTKVIYTDRAGNQVTCWAEDWTIRERRTATIKALRAYLKDHSND